MYDFQSAGEQYGIHADGNGSYLNIYHNTVSLDNHTVTASKETAGLYTGSFTNVNVIDNIFSVSRVTSDKNYGFHMAATILMFNSERNLFYVPSGGAANAVGYAGGTQATLANWQTKTGKDLLSTTADAQFTDPATFNLIPNNKAIDNMGQYVGINNDITFAVRNNQHPEIGAYEFLTPTCTGPAVGGAATILPTATVCEGSPMAINLTGNSFGVGQTYQWQTSATISGTYTNVGAALAHPATTMPAVSTLYYRVAVTCGTQVDYSTPVLVTVSPSLAANTYTINSAQATGGNNFQTFNDALNAIRCGIRGPVVFNVVDNGAVYREQLIIPKINGTSATNTVTFNGNGATMAFLSTNTNERAVVKFNGAQYFIFNNLKVNPEANASSTQYGVGFQFLNNATHNTVKNWTITMSSAVAITTLAGIVMSPAPDNYTNTSNPSYNDSNTIANNTIIGGQYGITCTSSPVVFVQGTVITNNIIKDFRQYGIWVTNTRDMLIEGNDISRPGRTLNISSMVGIETEGTHVNLRISKNKIHDSHAAIRTSSNGTNGIFNSGIADPNNTMIVSNNLMYNFSGTGAQNGIINSNVYNAQYFHNTIVLDDATASSQNTRGFSNTSVSQGLEIKDNNIVIKRAGTGAKYCIFIGDVNSTFKSDYNNFYNSATGGTRNFITSYNSTDYPALADPWKNDSHGDSNSISMDPVFKDPTNADFTPNIPAFDNKGVPVGITTDILGATRHAKPDIGAFEFSFCLALTKPVATVSNTTTNQVSFTWPAVTNATGYLVSTNGVNYVAPSSGATGTTHTVSNVLAGTDVSLTVIALGTTVDCPNDTSAKVTGRTACLQLGTIADPVVDTVTTTSIRFSWTAVANATGYKVSTDGANYIAPSSGPTGLYHVVTGLTAGTQLKFTVQAQGTSVNCPTANSRQVTGQTPNNKYFVPNAFTPNGNAKSDIWKVESKEIKSMRLMIFNQWGQKIFESSSQQDGWDGTFNGKQQPVGVYVYALTMTMMDGTVENKKGTISLIR